MPEFAAESPGSCDFDLFANGSKPIQGGAWVVHGLTRHGRSATSEAKPLTDVRRSAAQRLVERRQSHAAARFGSGRGCRLRRENTTGQRDFGARRSRGPSATGQTFRRVPGCDAGSVCAAGASQRCKRPADRIAIAGIRVESGRFGACAGQTGQRLSPRDAPIMGKAEIQRATTDPLDFLLRSRTWRKTSCAAGWRGLARSAGRSLDTSMEILALGVVPPRQSSALILTSTAEPAAASGRYDIYTSPSEQSNPSCWGRTDWQGR